jgi:hypothetical protein
MQSALLGTGGSGGGGDGGADNLEDVTLDFFTATPTSIGPFDTSSLGWHVNGVTPRVRIFLDNTQVGAAGSAIVQPSVTTGYQLSAISGVARKMLGHVTVQVDQSTCDEVELINILTGIRELIVINIRNPPDSTYKTYWAPDPDVTPSILTVGLNTTDGPPRIDINMTFRVKTPQWYVPNPDVTMALSVGLGILRGDYISVVPTANVSVTMGFLGWLAGIPLAIALAMASGDAQRKGLKIIRDIISYLNRVFHSPSSGKTLQRMVMEYRNGKPFIGYIECSPGARGITIVWDGSSPPISVSDLTGLA